MQFLLGVKEYPLKENQSWHHGIQRSFMKKFHCVWRQTASVPPYLIWLLGRQPLHPSSKNKKKQNTAFWLGSVLSRGTLLLLKKGVMGASQPAVGCHRQCLGWIPGLKVTSLVLCILLPACSKHPQMKTNASGPHTEPGRELCASENPADHLPRSESPRVFL